MEEMVSAVYDPNNDVFGVLERAIQKHHMAPSPHQRRKSADNIRLQRVKGADKRRGSNEEDITRRKGEMLEAYDPRDMEKDHSMEKLGRILDGKGSIRPDSLQT